MKNCIITQFLTKDIFNMNSESKIIETILFYLNGENEKATKYLYTKGCFSQYIYFIKILKKVKIMTKIQNDT